jgi:hypothetical protein
MNLTLLFTTCKENERTSWTDERSLKYGYNNTSNKTTGEDRAWNIHV